MRIVGLDLSLTSTGVATISTNPVCPRCGAEVTDSGGRHRSRCIRAVCRYEGPGDTAPKVSVARIVSKPSKDPTLADRSVRLRKLAQQATQACVGADLAVVEGPTYASTTGAAHDRAGFWWLVVGRLTGAGLNVVEVPPASVKTYATGKGNAGKDQVLAAVVLRYRHHVEVTGNDEADGLVLAAMGARFARVPIEDTLPQTHLRAMTGVRWTPTR